MHEALHESIETLVIVPERVGVIDVAQAASALGAKLTMALAELDDSKLYELDGSASMTSWCRVNLHWTNQQAARTLKIGRRLRSLPVTQAAWLDGRISDGQVDVIVANVTDRRADLWSDQEADIVPLLVPLDVVETSTVMQRWGEQADAILNEEEPPEEAQAEVTLAKTLDGRGYMKGSFDAEATDVIATGLRLADSGDVDVPSAERQGQAMVDVFRHFLDHQADQKGKRHRPHVNVVVTEDDLRHGRAGRTLHGTPLPGLVIRKLACDASIHRVVTDGASSILDYGRSTRTIPPAVYTSLVLRDLGCRFPGCDRPPEWCEGHHAVHWEDGGSTCLANLVLLCSKHHHVVHQKGWHLKLTPTGTVELARPDGTTARGDPPGVA